MIYIEIVEDELKTQEQLKEMVDKFFIAIKITCTISTYSNGEDFLTNHNMKANLVLMDINLPGKNGMEVAQELRTKDENVSLIFITSLAQYAIQGYSVNALDFILKPLNYEMLSMKLTHFMPRIERNRFSKIELNNKNCKREVSVSDILYIEVFKHTILFHLKDGSAFQTSGSLKKFENLLGDGFAYCHQSILVNLSQVKEIKNFQVKIGEELLPISRAKRKEFIRSLNLSLSR